MLCVLGLVQWPKRFKESQRNIFPTNRPAIVRRLNEEHERVLYIQASSLRALDPTTNLFTMLIGEGLFSNIDYNVGDHIADYNGEIISAEEGEDRDERGHGGYMHHINATTRMDCFVNAMNFRCKASKANSSIRAINIMKEGRGAIMNARIVKSTLPSGEPRVRLQATRNIPMHTEIITSYGNGFRYPVEGIE